MSGGLKILLGALGGAVLALLLVGGLSGGGIGHVMMGGMGRMMEGGLSGALFSLFFWVLLLALIVALVVWVIGQTQRR